MQAKPQTLCEFIRRYFFFDVGCFLNFFLNHLYLPINVIFTSILINITYILFKRYLKAVAWQISDERAQAISIKFLRILYLLFSHMSLYLSLYIYIYIYILRFSDFILGRWYRSVFPCHHSEDDLGKTRSEVFDQDPVTSSLLEEMLTFINSSFFCLLAVFDNVYYHLVLWVF